MAETPKSPRQPANRPTSAGNPTAPRRVAARKRQEERRQRLVITVTAATIGLALLAILAGVLYDQLWVPSQPVARVGDVTLSQGDYWTERRHAYAREIVQNFQLLALFGGNPQFTEQFQGQSPTIDNQVETIRSTEIDPAVLAQWETRQIKEQGAANLGISVDEAAVDQALVSDLGIVFLPPPTPPVTPTTEVAPTEEATTTEEPAATEEAATAEEPAATTGDGAAAPPAATATFAPTETPLPTPAPAEAATQTDQIIDEIYRRYEIELATAAEDPDLSKEDFRAALADQYRERVIDERVQAQLVPADDFVASEEPERIQVRQVFVAVTPPAEATQEQRDAAFAEAKDRTDTIAAELRGGADFATVAAVSSDDPGSREQGGDLGFFDRSGAADGGVTYPPELVERAFDLEEGVISDPIRTQFGWHIIEVTDRDIPSEEQQLREARTEALDAWVEEQRERLGVARFPESTPTPPAVPTEPIPTPEPTFVPGPPTAAPTETPLPAATGTP